MHMKTIKLPNHNNKLSCDVFAHIGIAPLKKISEDEFPMEFKIEQVDNKENNFAAELLTFARCRLMDLSSVETYLCAGMDRTKFIHWFMDNNKGVEYTTDVAVYIYKKQHVNTFLQVEQTA